MNLEKEEHETVEMITIDEGDESQEATDAELDRLDTIILEDLERATSKSLSRRIAGNWHL